VEPIAATVEKLVIGSLKRASTAAKAAEGPLCVWPLACGSAVAERTQAVSFRAGVLWVEVPDPGWRAQLAHLAPQYVRAINKYSATSVERIEFVVANKTQDRIQK
jgi:Dna[CI] antecedent, DciA